jgi:hypothetical protein
MIDLKRETILTLQDAAQRLPVGYTTLHRWITRGPEGGAALH